MIFFVFGERFFWNLYKLSELQKGLKKSEDKNSHLLCSSFCKYSSSVSLFVSPYFFAFEASRGRHARNHEAIIMSTSWIVELDSNLFFILDFTKRSHFSLSELWKCCFKSPASSGAANYMTIVKQFYIDQNSKCVLRIKCLTMNLSASPFSFYPNPLHVHGVEVDGGGGGR